MNDSGTKPGPLRPPRLGGSLGAPHRLIVPIGLGLLLYALAFVYFLPGINQRVNTYDEGVIVYGATRVLQGEVPYRDFWTMYSPGQFYILAAAFKLFGTTIETERLLDTALRALIPLFGFLIAAQLTNRRTALVAWAGTTVWAAYYAYFYDKPWASYGSTVYPALAFCMAAMWSMARYFAERGRCWLAASGVMLGVAALFRHDFGFYCGVGQVTALGLFCWGRSASDGDGIPGLTRFARAMPPFVLSAAAIVLPVAFAFSAIVPFNQLIQDLFTFPIAIFPRFRALPYPRELAMRNLPFHLPLVVIVAAAAIVYAAARRRTPQSITYASCMTMLIIFSALAFNQARVRSDLGHTSAVLIPSVVLLAILYRGAPPSNGSPPGWSGMLRAVVVVALVLTFATPVMDRAKLLTDITQMRPATATVLSRGSTVAVAPAMVRAIQYIQEHTQPQDRIFVGNTFHNKVFVSEPMFYFLAARDAATRYHELHPGVATTVPVQQEITADLEKHHVGFLVLSRRTDMVNEPNDSSRDSGVTILDDYIHAHFRPVVEFGPYAVWRRM